MTKRRIRSRWADKRLGFKHELVRTLVDEGFTYREALKIVDSIFDSIRTSLLRKEQVTIENFGSWFISLPKARRAYRFGKVINFKPGKVRFRMDDDALLFAFDPKWKPHASWVETEKRPPRLSPKQREELDRQQELERRQNLYLKYVRAIVKFFAGSLQTENWDMFWVLRWNTNWYAAEAKQHRPSPQNLLPIDEVGTIIEKTRPAELSTNRQNRVIELVCWYARWTAQLDVDGDLWDQAERDGREYLRNGALWARLAR